MVGKVPFLPSSRSVKSLEGKRMPRNAIVLSCYNTLLRVDLEVTLMFAQAV